MKYWHTVPLEGIDADILEFVAQPNSTITKKPIKNLNFPKEAIIGGIIRKDETIIAVGDTQILKGDKVVVFTLPGAVNQIEKFFK